MMKLCLIVLSLGGMIGSVETFLDSHVGTNSRPEVAFSQSALLAVPSVSRPDYNRAVEDALADAQGRDISLSDLIHPEEGL